MRKQKRACDEAASIGIQIEGAAVITATGTITEKKSQPTLQSDIRNLIGVLNTSWCSSRAWLHGFSLFQLTLNHCRPTICGLGGAGTRDARRYLSRRRPKQIEAQKRQETHFYLFKRRERMNN